MAKEKRDSNEVWAHLNILSDNLDKATALLRHVDTQANIFIGVCSGLFVFSLTQQSAVQGTSYALTVLAIFSGLGALFSLIAVHPPRSLRKQGQHESLFYHRRINKAASSLQYGRELYKLLGNREAIAKEYGTEIYNIYRYTYSPKRYFFNLGRNFLMLGIVLSLLVFAVTRVLAAFSG